MYAPKQPNQSRIPVTGPKTNDNQHATGSFRVPPPIIDNSQAPAEIQKYSSEKVDIITAKLAANANTQVETAPQGEVPKLGLVQRMLQNSIPRANNQVQKLTPLGESIQKKVRAQLIRRASNTNIEADGNIESSSQGQSIQTKLTVGEPGDKYEQEADGMARAVMSMPDSALQRQIPSEKQIQTSGLGLAQRMLQNSSPRASNQVQKLTPLGESIQKKVRAQLIQRASNRSIEAGGNIESQLNSNQGAGNPLSEQVRAYMEPRFGTDFSQVRVHTGESAVQMNQELGAQAFTHGSNIYYGAGKSPGVNELTAHELTHVVQQTGDILKKPSPNLLNMEQKSLVYESDTKNKDYVKSLLQDSKDIHISTNAHSSNEVRRQQTNSPQLDPKCSDLLANIIARVIELKERADALIKNKFNLPQSGPMSIEGHQQQFRNKQANLRKMLEKWDTDNCGPQDYLPANVWTWATMPAPSPAKNSNPQTNGTPRSGTEFTIGDIAKIAGTGVGLYVLYRVIRMLPSLLPPLWWTIPANTVAP